MKWIVAVIAAISMLGIGCAPAKPKIAGTWQAQGGAIDFTQTFKEDGTFSGETSMQGVAMTVAGVYKVEGDQMTMTVNDYSVTGREIPAAVKPQLDKTIKTTTKGTLTWNGNDEFSIKNEQANVTFKRKPAGGS
jgi:hypothetical protein